ncbi:MAG: hypothetical protein ACJAT7_003562 [Psychromonas sp.]|uniref:TetR/AcrR family transcriptional regulator n=1 Tax=Psychromonas sp. TaxID=1884585 RepID=UPI0039E2D456
MSIKKKQKQKILSAAKLVIKEKGIFNFTFSELSKASGVPNTSLHRIFKSKDDLLCSIFIERLKKQMLVMDYIDKSQLTAKEKIITHVYYAYFSIKESKDSVGDRFLITNHSLYKNASQKIIDEFEGLIQTLNYKVYSRYTSLKDTGIICVSSATIKNQIVAIHVISRGLAALAKDRYAPRGILKLKFVVNMLLPTLEELEWRAGPNSKYDIRNIHVMINTLSDNEFEALL